MALQPASLPAEYHPSPPEPPEAVIAAAAEEIRGALIKGELDAESGERTIGVSEVCAGFSFAGLPKLGDRHYYPWAVKRLIDAGLVEVLMRPIPVLDPNDAGNWFPRSDEVPSPAYFLRSTPELWRRWRVGMPLLEPSAAPARVAECVTVPTCDPPVARPRWDSGDRTLYFGRRLVKSYDKHSALSQVAIIEAFEEQNWPRAITPPDKVRDVGTTVRDLNRSLPKDSPISFSRDGTGKIRWAVSS
jgi:hypothetical protein